MNNIKSLGQVAFEAYRAEVQGVAYDGSGIPPWDSLDGDRAKAQRGWEAAALAVAQAHDAAIALKPGREIPSRWRPVAARPVTPEVFYGSGRTLSEAPAGQGEPPTGETVPVDVETDCDHPESCDIHGHEG